MNKSPDAFRTISEVAEILETPAHVLRFWESRFPQIRPVKRAGGRRYYRPADVALLTGIKRLLHDEGLTIRGVQKILREQGVRHVSGMADETAPEEDDAALEAALDAPDAVTGVEASVPSAEAETAQIIALQGALRQDAPSTEADEAPAPEPAPDALTLGPEHAVTGETALPKEKTTPPPATVADTSDADLFSRLLAAYAEGAPERSVTKPEASAESDDRAAPPTEPDAGPADAVEDDTEAPMQVWAEPEPEADADEDGRGAIPTLRITRIGAGTAPQGSGGTPVVTPLQDTETAEQDSHSEISAATLAQRLRATSRDSLSASDRATLAVLRAKARSLRDRLSSPPRSHL